VFPRGHEGSHRIAGEAERLVVDGGTKTSMLPNSASLLQTRDGWAKAD
jgi:hypothetical protein